MLIRTSIDGPLFYEFIFNLSFVPRLVCLSGFMLSPLGSEVMVSCHVAFFRVICYKSGASDQNDDNCASGARA